MTNFGLDKLSGGCYVENEENKKSDTDGAG